MKHAILIMLVGVSVASTAAAQNPEYGLITGPRLRAVALQSDPPLQTSRSYTELLKNVADAIELGSLDLAELRFKNLLLREQGAGRKGVPNGYLDFVLHHAATLLSPEAAGVTDRIRFHAAQEDATLLHLSLLEKQYSSRAGTRLPDFELREPVLTEFESGGDPVQRGLPQNVSTEELPERIEKWRTTLETVTANRTDAVREFTEAVQSNPDLSKRLSDAERRLAAVIDDVY